MLLDFESARLRPDEGGRRRELPAHTPAPAPSPLSQSPASTAGAVVAQSFQLEDLRHTLESIDRDQETITAAGRLRRNVSSTFFSPTTSPPASLTEPTPTIADNLGGRSVIVAPTPIMAATVSPSSSPRLPSPPPITEVQIGPKSPTIADSTSGNRMELGESSNVEYGASRRIRPGSKAKVMSTGPPLVPLSELDTAFQLQEHLQALYSSLIRPIELSHTTPITRETAVILATPPDGTDRALWLYELCRFLTNKMNNFIIAFFAESPPCSGQTCPEMRASEWQYLCAVHDPPKSCCAIDYCCHTLDWASNTLTSTKHFPSRLTLGSDASGGSQQGVRQLTNIFRRLYRIFAHAWFQHRHVFWQVEAQDGLYVFFKTVCDLYNLIPEESYTVPPEAEGIDTTPIAAGLGSQGVRVLKKEADAAQQSEAEKNSTTVIATGQTTRRHKATPSTGAAVNTVPEEEEEENKAAAEEQATRNEEPATKNDKPVRDMSEDNTETKDIAVVVEEEEEKEQRMNEEVETTKQSDMDEEETTTRE